MISVHKFTMPERCRSDNELKPIIDCLLFVFFPSRCLCYARRANVVQLTPRRCKISSFRLGVSFLPPSAPSWALVKLIAPVSVNRSSFRYAIATLRRYHWSRRKPTCDIFRDNRIMNMNQWWLMNDWMAKHPFLISHCRDASNTGGFRFIDFRPKWWFIQSTSSSHIGLGESCNSLSSQSICTFHARPKSHILSLVNAQMHWR